MKPKDAARIFDSLPDEVLVPVARDMKSDVLALVLASMNPDRRQEADGQAGQQADLARHQLAPAPAPAPAAGRRPPPRRRPAPVDRRAAQAAGTGAGKSQPAPKTGG